MIGSVAGIRTIAVAEFRSDRRLSRSWLNGMVVLAAGLTAYLALAFAHTELSAYSASVGLVSPRALFSWFAVPLLLYSMANVLLLSTDGLVRDRRDHFADVLYSRPMTNLDLLAGRFIIAVAVAWLPICVLGVLSLLLGELLNEAPEPTAVLSFVVFDALPTLLAWSALLALLASGLRNRFSLALVGLGVLGLAAWGATRLPAYLQPVLPISTWGLGSASEITPAWPSAEVALQRGALLVFSAGLLALASALHPRPDSSAVRHASVGAALVGLGALALAALLFEAIDRHSVRQLWLDTHLAHRTKPSPMIERLAGVVRIEPDESLLLDVELRLTAPPDRELDALLLSLNPGMTIRSVNVDGKQAGFKHGLGLLTIESALAPAATVELSLTASGIPDPDFAYLDSAVDRQLLPIGDSLALLGTEASLFSGAYVALMPGVRWLPLPGVNVGNDDFGSRNADFFELDLTVDVPAGWWVAGPGRRSHGDDAPSAGFTRFRLAPSTAVREVPIFASNFARRVTTVGDVTFELLLAPVHAGTLHALDGLAEDLRRRLQAWLTQSVRFGIPYPFDVLSLVEVPAQLRVYGGGLRLDTVQALPGVLLLREQGFPTARFDRLDGGDLDLGMLIQFFEADVTGGNVFVGATKNLMSFHTAGSGPGAAALDFVVDELAHVSVFGRRERPWLSAYRWTGSQAKDMFMTTLGSMLGQGSPLESAFAEHAMTRQPVWDLATRVALAGIEELDPQQALGLLVLKGQAIAATLLDYLGSERMAQVLAELRDRYAGGSFSARDFTTAAPELQEVVDDWVHESGLPGFVASPMHISRLRDDRHGQPSYQMHVHVLNNENVPGLFHFRYVSGAEDDRRTRRGAPIRIPGHTSVEVGWVNDRPPTEAWLVPYLAQNRGELPIDVPGSIADAAHGQPFIGVRASKWSPWPSNIVIVDDLDPGFEIERDSAITADTISSPYDATLDQGLPIFDPFTPAGRVEDWSRLSFPTSWGRYRQTLVRSPAGDGTERAVFVAELPIAGPWQLDYHLPALDFDQQPSGAPNDVVFTYVRDESLGRQGIHFMTLHADGRGAEIAFDASAARRGWNPVVRQDLPAGPVTLTVSNRTTSRTVVTDAIRWTRLDSEAATVTRTQRTRPASQIDTESPHVEAGGADRPGRSWHGGR